MVPEAQGPVLDVSGPDVERRIVLGDLQVLDIGRGHSNHLCLMDSSVSRNHALIRRYSDGQYTVRDLGSLNGTDVNEQRRVEGEVDLCDGDRIKIGEYKLRFTTPSGPVLHCETQTEPTVLMLTHKIVTVLVMDLHDYVGLSRRLADSDLAWLLAQLGERASSILAEHKAWYIKTIADAVMAVWVHDSMEAAPAQIEQPMAAALEIVEAVRRIGEHLREPLRTGAGITTGVATIGGLGAMGKVEVVGDTVNRAFRLEAATRLAGVDMLVCDQTRSLLTSVPEGIFRIQQTNVRGYREQVQAHGATFEALGLWLNG